MAGGGGPNPKGRNVENAVVKEITTLENGNKVVGFEMPAEDGAYFEQEGIDSSYRLIAVRK